MAARYRRFLIILTAFLCLALVMPIYAQEGEPVLLTEEEAYRRDAIAYVNAFGGTIEEAVRRLKLQPEIADLEVILQAQQRDTYSGLWIEHTPKFRVVVQLTRGDKNTIIPYVKNKEIADVIDVQIGKYTHLQQRTRNAVVVGAISRTGLPFEAKTDVQSGRIEVYVTDGARLLTALTRNDLQLPDNVEIVTVPMLSIPQATWYGGRSLSNCTTGLSIKNSSGTKFSSSADHCSSSDVAPLTRVHGFAGGQYDYVVLSVASGDTVKNWVADNISDSTPYYREINAYTARGSIGTAVCKNGRTTNYTCGTIEDNY